MLNLSSEITTGMNTAGPEPYKNSTPAKCKEEKPLSMIPRSKFIKKPQGACVKVGSPKKKEEENKVKERKEPEVEEAKRKVRQEKENYSQSECQSLPETLISPESEDSSKPAKSESSQVFFEAQKDSGKWYKDTEEVTILNNPVPKLLYQEDEKETQKQERMMKHLYEVFESTEWKNFDDVPDTDHQSLCGKKEAATIQQQYESTLRNIFDVWTNAISLITAVKKHTVNYFEESIKTHDREQITNEAEVLQLAIDFSVNYSKHKTDFLTKSMLKRLDIDKLEKSELEKFMDLKMLPAKFNDEDLATMAQTVRDLNKSILTEVNLDVD